MVVIDELEVVDIVSQKCEAGLSFVADRFLFGNQVTEKPAVIEASQVVSVEQRSQLLYFGWNTGPGGLVEISRVVVIHLLVFKTRDRVVQLFACFKTFMISHGELVTPRIEELRHR